ncbi:MAG: BamA/TamA family outer membrane protein [Bacteroidales bacterium]|nr:BamA/TamA family outer membrane protein [Bacteroidales bacterium]
MYRKKSFYILLFALLIVLLYSCSTTKVIPEGELRLAENKINILNSNSYSSSDLEPYIKQKPNDYFIYRWNPFLYVYNWSSGKGTGWDKFVEKIGAKPVIFDSTSIAGSKKRMLTHLEYLGYYDSYINEYVVKNKKIAKVHFDVTLGKQYYINNIKYIIKDENLFRFINNDSANFTIKEGTILSEETLENESERLAQLLRNDGYFGFTKNYFFFYADTSKTKDNTDLIVNVENYTRNESPTAAKPHKQYYLRDISIIPQAGFKVKQKFLNNLNRLEPGSLYNESEINNTYQRFTSNALFSTVNVQLEEVDSSLVDCKILLSPSKLQGIKVNMEGSFNSSGLLGLTPSFSYYHKNIFGSGEMLSVGFRGNFQFKLNDPVRSDELGISSSLTFPQFLFLPESLFPTTIPHTEISISYNFQDRPEYTRNIISTSLGYTWKMGKKFYYQIYPIQLNVVRIFNLSESFYDNLNNPYLQNSYKNHFDLGVGAMTYFTTDPSINPEKTYFYVRWQTDLSGNLLSLFNNGLKSDDNGSHLIWGIPYSQFVRSEITLVQTLKFGESNKFALAGRLVAGAGYAYGNSTALPFEKFFYAGGANSLRGWQSRCVGPGNAPMDSTFTIANQTGDMRLEGNMEFRFPLFWKLQGGFFLDVGNVWNFARENQESTETSKLGEFSSKNFAKSLAANWGLGLRLDFDMLLVRLDLGIKIYDPALQFWHTPETWFYKDGYAIHFGIGYPF